MSQPTPFQLQVWAEIKKIPRGQTRTYLQIAQALGKPKASRAVANACGQNPNLISTPCHRVIRTDGGLGGYSGPGGQEAKRRLLISEGVKLK